MRVIWQPALGQQKLIDMVWFAQEAPLEVTTKEGLVLAGAYCSDMQIDTPRLDNQHITFTFACLGSYDGIRIHAESIIEVQKLSAWE